MRICLLINRIHTSMDYKTPIVITSINKPTKAIKKIGKLKNFITIIVGDKKTPKDWRVINTEFLSIEDQYTKYPKLARAIPANHYARKNLGYLESIKKASKFIYETDDDGFPNKFFPNFYTKVTTLDEVSSPQVLNIYALFTKKKVWPRGFPLNFINKKITYQATKRKIFPYIQQSLADLDPDVDAIYRLTIGKKIRFEKNKSFTLAKNTFCPFNSQNTYWHKKAFPLLYLPSSVSSRVTDIWRGYIAQRVLWELDGQLIFLSPCCYQIRNKHNLLNDLHEEADCYLKSENLINYLKLLKLKGEIDEMLVFIYEHLVAKNFVKPEELNILTLWLKELQELTPR